MVVYIKVRGMAGKKRTRPPARVLLDSPGRA
jgi:hypothetical protein